MALEKIIAMYEIEKPDAVISAGDHSKDAIELSYVKDDVPYYIVRGNCDFYDRISEDILEFDLKNKKFYLTHGHLQGVKSGYHRLKMEAGKKDANVVIFGHTHIPYYEEEAGVYYFNPGAAKDGRYGILEFTDKKISFEHKRLG
jgi:hypothetical protein